MSGRRGPSADLVRDAQAGDLAARDAVVREMLSTVRGVAQHMCGDLDHDDLTQVGLLGVLRALDTYEAGKGATFRSYAHWWVRHYMQLERRKVLADGMTGLNTRRALHARKGRTGKAGGVAGASKDCRWQAGGEGTACRSDAERERLADRLPRQVVPISGLVGVGSGSEDAAITQLDQRMQIARIERAKRKMPRQAGQVLELRYGQGLTLQAIGDRLGVTAERVRRIELKALEQLRTALR